MKSSLLLCTREEIQYHHFGWCNEGYIIYDRLCTAIKKENIESVAFVGGGDHLLFIMHYFSPKVLINIDVSPTSITSTILKLAVLKHGTEGDWYNLVEGSLLESEIDRLIDKSKLNKIYEDILQYNTNEARKHDLWVMNLAYNKDHLLSSFHILQSKIKKVKEFHCILNSVWDIQLVPPVDLLLLSNAYNRRGGDIYWLVRSKGYFISTESVGIAVANSSLIESYRAGSNKNDGYWSGYLYQVK